MSTRDSEAIVYHLLQFYNNKASTTSARLAGFLVAISALLGLVLNSLTALQGSRALLVLVVLAFLIFLSSYTVGRLLLYSKLVTILTTTNRNMEFTIRKMQDEVETTLKQEAQSPKYKYKSVSWVACQFWKGILAPSALVISAVPTVLFSLLFWIIVHS